MIFPSPPALLKCLMDTNMENINRSKFWSQIEDETFGGLKTLEFSTRNAVEEIADKLDEIIESLNRYNLK